MIVFAASSEAHFHETSIEKLSHHMFISIIRHLAGMCLVWQLAKSCSFGSQWYWIWQKAKHRGKRYFQITIFTSKIQDQKSHLQNENLDCASFAILPWWQSPGILPSLSPPKTSWGRRIFLGVTKSSQPEGPQSYKLAKSGLAELQSIPLCHRPTPQQVF